MNVHLFQPYTLGRAILAASGVRLHQIRDTAARRLVHHLLAGMMERGELSTFALVWDKRGFTQLMVSWLREMKSQGIPPEAVAAHATLSGQVRDRQLAERFDQISHRLFEPGKAEIAGDISDHLALVEALSREQEVR